MSKTKKSHTESESEHEKCNNGISDSEEEKYAKKMHRSKTTKTKNQKEERRSSSSSSASSASKSSHNSASDVETSANRIKEKSVKSNKPNENRSKWDSPVHGSKKRVYSRSRSRSESRGKQRKDERRRNDHESKYDRDDRARNKNERHNFRDDNVRYRGRRDGYERDRDRERDYECSRDERRDRNVGSSRYNEYKERSRSPRRDKRSPKYEARERKHQRYNRRSRSRNRNDDNDSYAWGKKTHDDNKKPVVKQEDKEKPNFGLSGALTEDTNKVNGVVVKYAEPLEARRPKRRWRLYPFKGETALPVLHIHRQSCFLVGRDRKVVDLAVDHPSCSKQHAALQYRLVNFKREDGSQGKRVRLYLIDLDSANGTFLNNKKIEPRKYYELLEKDVIKFGFSTREYVLLHENSKEDQEDDDVTIKQEPEDETNDKKTTP